MVPLMNCVSQEQNAGYSSEPHNLCEREGDGSSAWWLRLQGLLSAQGDTVGVIWSRTSLQHHPQILHCHLLLCSYLVLLIPIMGSLGFERGDLEYVSNTSWSTRTYCTCLGGLQFLLLLTAEGQFVQGVGREQVPVPAARVPGPAGALGTGLVPQRRAEPSSCQQHLLCQQPGEGREPWEPWEPVARQGQREAILSVGCLCAWYLCLRAHAQAFQELVCHRRGRLNNSAVQDRNGLSFILISSLCLCWHAATAGNDGYRKGNLWYDGKIHISSTQGRCTKAACRSVFPGTWALMGFS